MHVPCLFLPRPIRLNAPHRRSLQYGATLSSQVTETFRQARMRATMKAFTLYAHKHTLSAVRFAGQSPMAFTSLHARHRRNARKCMQLYTLVFLSASVRQQPRPRPLLNDATLLTTHAAYSMPTSSVRRSRALYLPALFDSHNFPDSLHPQHPQ